MLTPSRVALRDVGVGGGRKLMSGMHSYSDFQEVRKECTEVREACHQIGSMELYVCLIDCEECNCSRVIRKFVVRNHFASALLRNNAADLSLVSLNSSHSYSLKNEDEENEKIRQFPHNSMAIIINLLICTVK